MRLRPLPFIVELERLSVEDPKGALARRDNAMHELVRCPGFQLVVAALQVEQHEAVEALRRGDARPEFNSGRAAAITATLARLASLFPEGSAVDTEPEEEVELPVYGDLPAFDIPYPTSGE